ncbi:MAG TPA: M1 family metallopeptidase [Bacteroidia bacterium]|nr:M1 family metallopeptidase [Bacteroidia bacterium]
MKQVVLIFYVCLICQVLNGQNIQNNPQSNHGNKFEQLGTILPDANDFRSASGAPGNAYWQQRADYDIDAFLNEKELRLEGSEQVTYFNNSPDALNYLWLQLDENEHRSTSDATNFDGSKLSHPLTDTQLQDLDVSKKLNGLGVNIISVTDALGAPLHFIINNTMMRIDLPVVLKSRQQFVFKIKWNYKIPERLKVGGRGGCEFFEGDGNYTFTMAQWYPRMCVYSDYQGWNNKQFTGRGEFALAFGNFKVRIKAPADHMVGATGVCTNLQMVLPPAQFAKWTQAKTSDKPIEITTLEEAKAKEKNPDHTNFKTWNFSAENVRDFAWTSSRKFVWDAMGVKQDGKTVMCMSYYPKEAYTLYNRYSTKVVAHTIKTYSKYTIPYPYPTAISVEAANGMEYPMICFNYGRTEADGTYPERIKNGMIAVVIHEVGHNFFPMIVNSDERQWAWMDEGINSFLQFLTEQELDNNFPSARGPAFRIVDYMKLPKNQLEPLMVNTENIIQYGPNAYGKASSALNILRETIMGRELFDFAFKQYSQRWAFKHPTPADFFRTMEDASAVDLDWFWRGWFYDIEPVDISIDSVKAITVSHASAPISRIDTIKINKPAEKFQHITQIRNRENGMKFLVDVDTTLRDFYFNYKPVASDYPMYHIRNRYDKISVLSDSEAEGYEHNFYYEIQFSNKGGTVMPIIIQWNYIDGTSEIERINAYIWRKDEKKVTKTFAKFKEVASIQLDPYKETADIDEKNNNWPKTEVKSRFELYKGKRVGRFEGNDFNLMQRKK